ncbi:hypothetical protein K435DRAFT_871399 [Dendrothele bispora CBS 962.96]|uniref:F-box domain-containing protein n=1 Tax=Dendrothele bispora (strain CBS 962.96) TaxID=1314807 RepID=A0A4S8L5K0_DENBC|nr:hypothetical protein K435DRAFT_871399 [Dendrothele bispora CBS 962.96]
MEPHLKEQTETSNGTVSISRSSRVAACNDCIPPEILLLIMNELRHSKASLKEASLVCRAWHGPAQVSLFFRVDIRQLRDCKRILEIFQKSPHLTSHVKRLVIGGPEEKQSWPCSRASYLQSKEAMEIASMLGSSVRELGVSVYPLEKNVDFLKHMRRVQTLRIESYVAERRLDILAELIQCMRNINTLHLFCPNTVPYREEYETGRLELLTATTTTLGGAVSTEPTLDTPPLRLTRLTLFRVEQRFDLLKFLLDPRYFDLGVLERLDLTWMDVKDQHHITRLDYTLLDRLFRRVGPSLKGLSLDFAHSHSILPDSLPDRYIEHYTMSLMTSPLQCLVTLESFSVASKGIDPSPYLALLTSVPSLSLTHVQLQTYIDVNGLFKLGRVLFEEDSAQYWQVIDSLLGDKNRFPVLQSLTITAILIFLDFIDERNLCLSFATALGDNEAREMKNMSTEELFNRTSTQIAGLFEMALVRSKERGLLHVKVEKQVS